MSKKIEEIRARLEATDRIGTHSGALSVLTDTRADVRYLLDYIEKSERLVEDARRLVEVLDEERLDGKPVQYSPHVHIARGEMRRTLRDLDSDKEPSE